MTALNRRRCVVGTGDEHQRVQESFGLYVLGAALSPADRAMVEDHLAMCRVCVTESDRLAEAVLSLAVFTRDEGSELVDAYGAPPARPKQYRTRLIVGGLAVLLAVAVGVVLAIVLTGR